MYSLTYEQIFLESDFLHGAIFFVIGVVFLVFACLAYIFVPSFIHKKKTNDFNVKGIISIVVFSAMFYFLLTGYFRLNSGEIHKSEKIYMNYAQNILFAEELRNSEIPMSYINKLGELRSLYNHKPGSEKEISKLDSLLTFPEKELESLQSLYKTIVQDQLIENYEFYHFRYKVEEKYNIYIDQIWENRSKLHKEKALLVQKRNEEFDKNLEQFNKKD